MEELEIGTPVYGNEGSKRPNSGNANWRLDSEGSHIYRILPPFGALAKLGRWSQYEALHWGATLSNGKQRCFRCVQRKNRKTKMIEVECPMCTKIAKQRKLFDSQKAALDAEGAKPEKYKAVLQPLSDWLRQFNLQKGHFLNVLRQDGQMGRLFLKIKCKQSLDVALDKVRRSEKLDPILATEGVWLDFVRSGMGRDNTVYTVEPVYESVSMNGRNMKAISQCSLTPDILTRMKKEAFDLSTFYRDLPSEKIQELIDSDFEPSVVDSVFGAPTVSTMVEEVEAEESFSSEEATEMSTATTPVGGDDAAEAAILAQLKALREKKGGQRTTEAKQDMDTEDFLKAFNSGKL